MANKLNKVITNTHISKGYEGRGYRAGKIKTSTIFAILIDGVFGIGLDMLS
jgi:hypothetical protein